MKSSDYTHLLLQKDSYLRYGGVNTEENPIQKGCFKKVTSALYNFFRSPFTVYASIVGTSVAASAAALTNFHKNSNTLIKVLTRLVLIFLYILTAHYMRY